jgi:uncharacterized protein YeaO (DUF488 family)
MTQNNVQSFRRESIAMTDVLIKRAYEKPAKSDGFRVLVDRVWPRGISKEALHVDLWARGIAPSTALRQWFGHDPARWTEFRKRYERELSSHEAVEAMHSVVEQAKGAKTMTLVYGAKDVEHNQAVILRERFERMLHELNRA